MKVGIIGLGLIGGSMAIDLKRKGFADEIIGVEADPVNAAAAEKIGLVDRVAGFHECVESSDVVILAVPVGAAVRMLPQVLDLFAGSSVDGKTDKVVMDVCSTKEHLARSVKYHPMRKCYVASHPMAGTEYSGPWAAMPGLYDGHACAYVSHISHVTSFALALTVLDKERDEKHIFDLASGGFSSTVRLAKSSPDMWTPILSQNRDNVLQVMDTYIEKMNAFRQAIADGDEDMVRRLIEDANRIRRIIR